MLTLTLGSFVVPFLGPLIGLLLMWFSERWTLTDKVVATVIGSIPSVIVIGFIVIAFYPGSL